MGHFDQYEHEDPQPNSDELKRIAALKPEQIQTIDEALLAAADARWRKVAFIVAMVMTGPSRMPGIPDSYYSGRVKALVSIGALEAQGILSRMRYSEVRLAARGVGIEA